MALEFTTAHGERFRRKQSCRCAGLLEQEHKRAAICRSARTVRRYLPDDIRDKRAGAIVFELRGGIWFSAAEIITKLNQPPRADGSVTSPLLKSTYSSVKSAAYITALALPRFKLMCNS